jgi:hypothetical protein
MLIMQHLNNQSINQYNNQSTIPEINEWHKKAGPSGRQSCQAQAMWSNKYVK